MQELPIEAIVPECLQKLLDYDEDHGTSLVAVLEAYLDCGRSVARASQAVFLHRNTFASRLALARGIVGDPLDDPEGELGMRIALRALRQ